MKQVLIQEIKRSSNRMTGSTGT